MEHLQLRIKNIKRETTESKTFIVEEINGNTITYKAGQFITLLVRLHGKEVRRSYSISSTPHVDPELFFTIKRVENGELSRFLFDDTKIGDVLTALPPTGRFVIDDPGTELSVFIAAGSGITPVFSLVKHLLYDFSHPKVVLIYQNRNEAEAIFRNQFLQLQQQFESMFILKEIFSQPIENDKMFQRLNNNLLEAILKSTVKAEPAQFYLCGPATFMRMAEFTLKVMHYGP